MVSIFILILFTAVILAQIIYLGKYISIVQGIFINKTFLIFALGAVTYFSLSFIVLTPFIWLDLQIIYYALILITKDFFTIVFLSTRREKFRNININWHAILTLIVAIIIFSVINKYLINKIYNITNINVKTKYHFLTIYSKSIETLTISSTINTHDFLIYPLFGTIIFAIVAGIYMNFIKKQKWFDYLFTYFLTFASLLLFNVGKSLDGQIIIFLILFAFLAIYNLVTFSRRRYGTLFALIVITSWGIDPSSFWVIFGMATVGSLSYIILKKPNASLFIFQLFGSVIIIATMRIMDFSITIAWLSLIFGFFAYTAIFIFGRIKIIDISNRIIAKLYLAIPTTIFITIIATAIGVGFANNVTTLDFLSKNELFNTYGNKTASQTLNILWFVLLIIMISWTIIWKFQKNKFVKWKLVVLLSLIGLLYIYNPMFSTIIEGVGDDGYQYMKSTAILPLIIIGLACAKNRVIK